MELKGIGEKLADYIIELRETSPLKSLEDMEKIGLSSKQIRVKCMFSHNLRDSEEEAGAIKSASKSWYKTMISDSDYTEFENFTNWLGVS